MQVARLGRRGCPAAVVSRLAAPDALSQALRIESRTLRRRTQARPGQACETGLRQTPTPTPQTPQVLGYIMVAVCIYKDVPDVKGDRADKVCHPLGFAYWHSHRSRRP